MTGTGLDFGDFDRYCDEHGIKPGEEPAAFAAWLHEISGGRWDGRAEQVTGKEAGAVTAFERVRGNAIYTPSELAEREARSPVTREERERAAEHDHTCPRCGARKMDPCRTMDPEHNVMRHPHDQRVRLVKEG